MVPIAWGFSNNKHYNLDIDVLSYKLLQEILALITLTILIKQPIYFKFVI